VSEINVSCFVIYPYQINSVWYFFPGGVKLPVHEADHSHRSSAKFKNVWNYTSIFPIRLHGVDTDNFTFNLPLFITWGHRHSL
jgi:uncharacterized membrane protein